MTTGTTEGASEGDAGLWTLVFDDGTTGGLRVACGADKVEEYIVAGRARASTPAIAPGTSERIPLGEVARFAPLFHAAELGALSRSGGVQQAASLRFFATLCKICAYFFVVVGIIWLIASLAGGIKLNGAKGFMGMLVAGLLGIIPIAAIPVAFFTLSALAEGVATLLDQGALRRVRGR